MKTDEDDNVWRKFNFIYWLPVWWMCWMSVCGGMQAFVIQWMRAETWLIYTIVRLLTLRAPLAIKFSALLTQSRWYSVVKCELNWEKERKTVGQNMKWERKRGRTCIAHEPCQTTRKIKEGNWCVRQRSLLICILFLSSSSIHRLKRSKSDFGIKIGRKKTI